MQSARELEAERRRAEALSAEHQAARQQLAALRAEVGALKQQRGQRLDQQQAAFEVCSQRALLACTRSGTQEGSRKPSQRVASRPSFMSNTL